MAGYSKESKRQNKALEDLMSGKEYQKDYIQVGYEGKTEDKGGETRKGRLSDIMADLRMPLFCKRCDKAMKKKLDDKFWMKFGHCFDCQVEIENKLRISGEWEKHEKLKVLNNKKSYLKDLQQSIDEFEETGGKAECFNQVGVNEAQLEKESWEMGEEQFDGIVKEAREHISNLQKDIDEEEKLLNTA